MKRRRTRFVTAIEAARAKQENIEANIEFPILTPRSIDAPQEPTVEEPQIESLLSENDLLKEKVEMLRIELEKWKEKCRKQVEKRLHTLVEVADHLEGSPPVLGGEGQEEVVCPECGEIFN